MYFICIIFQINARLKDKHLYLLKNNVSNTLFFGCLKAISKDKRKMNASCWHQERHSSSFLSYECFPRNILPYRFWGCVSNTERASLGEAERDRTMAQRYLGRAQSGGKSGKMNQKDMWLLTDNGLCYCPNAGDSWDRLAATASLLIPISSSLPHATIKHILC